MELKPRPPEIAAEINREFSRIGVNINQIARVANARQAAGKAELEAVAVLLSDLWRRVKEL